MTDRNKNEAHQAGLLALWENTHEPRDVWNVARSARRYIKGVFVKKKVTVHNNEKSVQAGMLAHKHWPYWQLFVNIRLAVHSEIESIFCKKKEPIEKGC